MKYIVIEKSKKFTGDIEKLSEDNKNFRKVLFTAKNIQLVVMSLKPGEDIGVEKHNNDQFFRIEGGQATIHFNGKEKATLEDGGSAIIPAGMYHNIVNTGKKDLKLYTIYGPPHHPPGTIERTKKIEKALDNKYFKVDRADDCIWLTDKRGDTRVIHLVPEQAKEIGKELVSISKSRGGFRMAKPKMGEEEKARNKEEGEQTFQQKRMRRMALRRREENKPPEF